MLVFFILVVVSSVVAWGPEGHKIVGAIASSRLSSKAAKQVDYLLNGKTLEDIAPLPDNFDHSRYGEWSAPLHYDNLPRGATRFEFGYCPSDHMCVSYAVQNYTKRFSTQTEKCRYSDDDTPCDLEFLTHFMGDIHQPLHVAYGDDRGGNDVIVSWFGSTVNLHKVWDEEIISKWQSQTSSAVNDLTSMIASEPGTISKYLSNSSAQDMSDESFGYVRSTVYNYTVKNRVPQLDEDYYNRNLPIVQQRLIAAGVRLAQAIDTATNKRKLPVRIF